MTYSSFRAKLRLSYSRFINALWENAYAKVQDSCIFGRITWSRISHSQIKPQAYTTSRSTDFWTSARHGSVYRKPPPLLSLLSRPSWPE